MKMIFDSNEYIESIIKSVDEFKPTSICLSTFGIYAGISSRYADTRAGRRVSKSRRLLEVLESVGDVKILVGVSPYNSCHGTHVSCKSCKTSYVHQLCRLMWHKDTFNNFSWRFSGSHHLKCVVLSNKQSSIAYIGGRNCTDSDWTDASFQVPMELDNDLVRFFRSQWNLATEVNDENIAQLASSNGITEAEFISAFEGDI